MRSLGILVLALLVLILAHSSVDRERVGVARLVIETTTSPPANEQAAGVPTARPSPFRFAAHGSARPTTALAEAEFEPESPILVVPPLVPLVELPDAPNTARLPPYDVIIPVEGVAVTDLIDTFAEPRGTDRRHLAIDILAPSHTPVRAAAAGTVLRLHRSPRGGITLYLLDEIGRYVYYYAHLQGYAAGIREGQRVEAGDPLGYVGHTGNAHESVPHLHFAIWKQAAGGRGWGGRPVNPFLVLTREPTAPGRRAEP